ncbi:hypothetical protein HPB47_012969, partial [Ixodes persulcatus]
MAEPLPPDDEELAGVSGSIADDNEGAFQVVVRGTKRHYPSQGSGSSEKTIITQTKPTVGLVVLFTPVDGDVRIDSINSVRLTSTLKTLVPSCVIEVRFNRRKNLLANDTQNGQTTRTLLGQTTFCGMKVSAFELREKASSVGIVRDIDSTLSDSAIVGVLRSTVSIRNVRPIGKSTTIRVKFASPTLSEHVYVCLVRHGADLYVNNPIQCHRCEQPIAHKQDPSSTLIAETPKPMYTEPPPKEAHVVSSGENNGRQSYKAALQNKPPSSSPPVQARPVLPATQASLSVGQEAILSLPNPSTLTSTLGSFARAFGIVVPFAPRRTITFMRQPALSDFVKSIQRNTLQQPFTAVELNEAIVVTTASTQSPWFQPDRSAPTEKTETRYVRIEMTELGPVPNFLRTGGHRATFNYSGIMRVCRRCQLEGHIPVNYRTEHCNLCAVFGNTTDGCPRPTIAGASAPMRLYSSMVTVTPSSDFPALSPAHELTPTGLAAQAGAPTAPTKPQANVDPENSQSELSEGRPAPAPLPDAAGATSPETQTVALAPGLSAAHPYNPWGEVTEKPEVSSDRERLVIMEEESPAAEDNSLSFLLQPQAPSTLPTARTLRALRISWTPRAPWTTLTREKHAGVRPKTPSASSQATALVPLEAETTRVGVPRSRDRAH